jgi:hypothetical protein
VSDKLFRGILKFAIYVTLKPSLKYFTGRKIEIKFVLKNKKQKNTFNPIK